jgi:phosphonopyruvate decarboxylase
MIDPARFIEVCRRHGVTFFTGVPDSLLKELNHELLGVLPRDRHVIAANEGAAMGIAIGHYLRTGRPAAIYLQNSGFGNLLNPLLSLADPDVYGVPMLLIVGWRGQPGHADEPQHVKQGRVMVPLLDALELPWSILSRDPVAAEHGIADAVTAAVERSGPSVLLVEKGTFAGSTATVPRTPAARRVSREEALVALAEVVGGSAVIVSTTGMLSRELFEHRVRTGGGRDFLVVGGMGHACSIALGVALRERDREVWCFDGDGALLMHLGSLAVIADHAPANYFHAVFNNGVHDSVGGQPTSIGAIDVPAAARALGYRYAASTGDPAMLPRMVAALRAHGGPALLELRVRPGSRPGLGRPTDSPAAMKRAFMAALDESADAGLPEQQNHR